ncbi:1,4-dihydroxy-2-naphthoate polyprenyltransferase [Agrococcus casei]|uniref:1,4-dihydroxy-2-naphthoate polyprenyltransferase n=1 Tax=Agrococcus casei TaxID=343512 RepID=UPI003F8E3130
MAKQRRSSTRAGRDAAARRSGNPAKRNAVIEGTHRVTAGDWIAGARLRTLGMAVGTVAAGSGIAAYSQVFSLPIGLLCLALALFLQIGVNFANDYSDGIRGTDEQRTGPSRLTGSGKAEAKTVRNVALTFLALGAAAGLAIVLITQLWWLLAVGVVAILAAWFYTGGKRPYGYMALGEVVSFVFFGPVPVVGTVYAMSGGTISEDAIYVGLAMGSFAAASMLVNNIRDIDSDRAVGKRTLATLMGRTFSRVLYGLLMLLPFTVVGIYSLVLMHGAWVMLVMLIALPAVVIVGMGNRTKDFILGLSLSGISALLVGVGFGLAFWGRVTGFNNPYL